jgi:hypothetical protein
MSGAAAKGGGPATACTVSATEAAWVDCPAVPVNVKVAVVAAAPDAALTFTLCEPPAARLNDAGVAVTPAGTPPAATVTVPLNEFTAAAETVTCEPDPPTWIVTVAGDADNEKSGVAAGGVDVDLELPQDCSNTAAATQLAMLMVRTRGNDIRFSPQTNRPVRSPMSPRSAPVPVCFLDAGTGSGRYPRENQTARPAPSSALRVFKLFVPRHLDRFQPRLIRLRRIVRKTLQLRHVLQQIREPHRQRIDIRKLFLQLNPDLF